VAAKTGLAESTVKMHRGRVMRKMGAKSLADLIKVAEIIVCRATVPDIAPRVAAF
jgi:FixJ family two-component response regulator